MSTELNQKQTKMTQNQPQNSKTIENQKIQTQVQTKDQNNKTEVNNNDVKLSTNLPKKVEPVRWQSHDSDDDFSYG